MARLAHPDFRFLVSHPAHFIALGAGSGLPHIAPGTFGTLFGWGTFVLLEGVLTPVQWAIALSCGFILGIWACRRTGRDLGVPDHGAMVWDEILAMWLVLVFTPQGLLWQCAAFVVFRGFDIIKPPPIRYFDRRWKGGFGVMFDDMLAAFFTLMVLAAAVRLLE